MKGSIRSFIGVPLTPSVSAALTDRLSGLKATVSPAAVRWLVPANYHLTLQFMGNIDRQAVAGLCPALTEAVAGIAAFDLPLDEIACFPDAKSVVVAALATAEAPLLELVERVGQAVERVGIKRDSRRYHAHITLGRIKRRPLKLARTPLTVGLPVQRVALYQSATGLGGRVYTVLADFPLSG
jgi:2'-5' RNA ligase